jgi:hypothetical protein
MPVHSENLLEELCFVLRNESRLAAGSGAQNKKTLFRVEIELMNKE